jgi:hypothetical protein
MREGEGVNAHQLGFKAKPRVFRAKLFRRGVRAELRKRVVDAFILIIIEINNKPLRVYIRIIKIRKPKTVLFEIVQTVRHVLTLKAFGSVCRMLCKTRIRLFNSV